MFNSQDLSFTFTVKVASNIDIVKVTKIIQIYGENPRSDHPQIWLRNWKALENEYIFSEYS